VPAAPGGRPILSLSASPSDVPPWMTVTDDGDGTITFAGTPPVSVLSLAIKFEFL
jgi:hypothetical protein